MSQDDNLELLNTFAHDMKTPLGAVLHYADLIQQVGPLNESQKKFLDRITANADKMLALVKDLLAFAQLENDRTLHVADVHLGEMVQTILTMLDAEIAAKRLTVSVTIAPSVGTLQADVRRIQHVLQNLLSNAVKYNREGGEVRFVCADDGDTVRITVQDTGIGIPPRALPRLFEKFYRVKQPKSQPIEGTGLGLAIVKHAVDMHGGQVWVESEQGKGTTFTVLLPRVSALARSQAQSGELLDGVDDDRQEPQDASDNDSPLG